MKQEKASLSWIRSFQDSTVESQLCVQVLKPMTVTAAVHLPCEPVAGGPTVTVEYELYAVVMHSGSSPEHGHYFTYCKGSDGGQAWRRCDDATVAAVDVDGDLSCLQGGCAVTPYVLFYQRVDAAAEDASPSMKRPCVDNDVTIQSLFVVDPLVMNTVIADNVVYLKELESGSASFVSAGGDSDRHGSGAGGGSSYDPGDDEFDSEFGSRYSSYGPRTGFGGGGSYVC